MRISATAGLMSPPERWENVLDEAALADHLDELPAGRPPQHLGLQISVSISRRAALR